MFDISTNSSSRIRLTNLASSDETGLNRVKQDKEAMVALAVEELFDEEAATAAASRSRS